MIGDIVWDLLELKVGGVRYGTWLQARAQVEPLLQALHIGRTFDASPVELRDTLNTAWAARLAGPADALMAVADWGLRACTARVPTEGDVEEGE